MSDILRLTLVQTYLHWQQPEKNRQMLAEKLAPLAGTTDLVLLPEMFTTGFSMEPERHSEVPEGATLDWMQTQAEALGAALAGTVAIALPAGYVNRLLLVTPDGSVQFYDKRHLFRMGGEHEHYLPGQKRACFDYLGWRILPMICYDLRFPVFSRNLNDYDLALYLANWPAPRREAWRTLLAARAIENQAYVAGVNRIGADNQGVDHAGDSQLYDFKGQALLQSPTGSEFVQQCEISRAALHDFREKFPAWRDGDAFSLDLGE